MNNHKMNPFVVSNIRMMLQHHRLGYCKISLNIFNFTNRQKSVHFVLNLLSRNKVPDSICLEK